MAGKPSKDHDAARVAFEKSVANGKPLSPVELSRKFNVSTSTIYRATWWKKRPQGVAK